ncbi:lectin-like domain-containing protein [Carnobacterium maltaromaticum]|uniref:lectin-like domain-containing protein n=1 Tax=Carnobacterium maltaromaticum TaxID=2751 RepID=UPI00295E7577|nr:Ig-like domain-containing protein [Carnobacterium maltaromaticum]
MKNTLKNKIVFSLLFVSMIIFQIVWINRAVEEEKISANPSTTETINEENLNPRIGEVIVVTRENFLAHFTLAGNANYQPASGIVTLTQDENNIAGSFTLNKQIDLESSFRLKGRVNLGNKTIEAGTMIGGDGMGFGFHGGGVSQIGFTGNGMGMAGLPNAFGFKLDTYFNNQTEEAILAAADPNSVGKGRAFGAFVYSSVATSKRFLTSETSSVQIIPNPTSNQFKNFEMDFDTNKDKLTIVYDTQTWEKDISTFHEGVDALSFIVSASTGGAKNLQQFEFETIEYTPELFLANPIPQDVILGEDLTKRDLQSFVTNVTYGGIPLNPNEYNVTLKAFENDLVGKGKATVIVEHNSLGIRIETEVPLDVLWGDTILALGNLDKSVGAFTYHPTENRITANQGTYNGNSHVDQFYWNQESYSVDLYRLFAAEQKISDASNYLSHTVFGSDTVSDAVNKFAGGAGSISTKVSDIIKFRERQGRLQRLVEGQPQSLPKDRDLSSFLELTQTGYRQLAFNLLETNSSNEIRTISKDVTNKELDQLIPSLLDKKGHDSVEIMGFSQYPNRESLGESIGKILVREPLSNGVSYVQHEYEFMFNVISSAIPVTGVEVTPKVVEMVIGDNVGLTEMVIPSNATNNAVRWESSNLAIASVSTEGVVTGLSPGTVTISVFTEDGNRTDSSQITVIDDGVLKFSQFAESLNFRDIILGTQEVISSRENEGPLVTVTDTRWNKDPYSIQVTLERELSRPNGSIVPGALFFLNSLGESQTLSQTSLEVFNHSPQQSGSGDIERMEIDWEEDEGILLRMPPEEMVITDFSGSIRWNLVSGPF